MLRRFESAECLGIQWVIGELGRIDRRPDHGRMQGLAQLVAVVKILEDGFEAFDYGGYIKDTTGVRHRNYLIRAEIQLSSGGVHEPCKFIRRL